MEEASGGTHTPDTRILRWVAALEPLLDRTGPLSAAEAQRWRRRLPALIASGELLRYRNDGAGQDAGAAALLAQALEEARCLLAELADAPGAGALTQRRPRRVDEETRPPADAIERARAQLCRSAARREVEPLVRGARELVEIPPVLTVAIPPGCAPGLRSFNLCFFAFLGFQTLLWASGALSGADATTVCLYALILAPFWWWGAYLFQALALTLGPEELMLAGRCALLRRAWLGTTALELPADAEPVVDRECWFEINRHPVHCLTLRAAGGRRIRFAVGRDAGEHERLLAVITGHLTDHAAHTRSAGAAVIPLREAGSASS